MARETFEICDRCGFRKIVGQNEDVSPIEQVAVWYGADKAVKDLCRNCRIDLGKWINEKVPIPPHCAKEL